MKMMSTLALASALALAGCKKKTETAAGSGSATASAATPDAAGSDAALDSAAAPSPGVSTGSPECDAYLQTFDEIVATCKDRLGPAFGAMKQSRDAMAEGFKTWPTLGEAERNAAVAGAAKGCRASTDALRKKATALGCTL